MLRCSPQSGRRSIRKLQRLFLKGAMSVASSKPIPIGRITLRGFGASNFTSGRAAMGRSRQRRHFRSCKAGVPRRMGSQAEGERKELGYLSNSTLGFIATTIKNGR